MSHGRVPATTATRSSGWPRSSSRGTAAASGPSPAEYAERYPELAERIRDALPGAGADGAASSPARDEPTGDSAEAAGRAAAAAGAARRLPDPPRGRPRRHGRRLRGRAGVAGPPRGAEGPARPQPLLDPRQTAPVPARGAGGGAAAPHQHRAGLRRRRAGRACTTTSCSSSRARGSTRSSTSCGGCAGRAEVQPPPRTSSGRNGDGSAPPRPPTWPGRC